MPAGARKRWEAYLQRYASHRCECRCPKMPLHDDAFPRPPLSMAGSTKSSVSVRGGIWKRTLPCQTPGRFFRYHGPNAPSGLPFGTKQKTSACSATERAPLPCLAAESQEKALPNKWPQTLHERRGCKKQLNSKTPRFVEAFINMDTTPQTHNENFSIIIVCIKLNLLHPYC